MFFVLFQLKNKDDIFDKILKSKKNYGPAGANKDRFPCASVRPMAVMKPKRDQKENTNLQSEDYPSKKVKIYYNEKIINF